MQYLNIFAQLFFVPKTVLNNYEPKIIFTEASNNFINKYLCRKSHNK